MHFSDTYEHRLRHAETSEPFGSGLLLMAETGRGKRGREF